jgi:hypothetical protein
MKYTIGSANSFKGFGNNNFAPFIPPTTGRVYGVVTTENTPTAAMFKKVGGFNAIGTIFYLNYNESIGVVGSMDDAFLDGCSIAKPISSQIANYPVLHELVNILNLPSSDTQQSPGSTFPYYTLINLWNSVQQNAQPANINANLGITFVENSNIRSLLPFEGDYIIQGRQGGSIRFSSTTKLYSDKNEWSSIGNEDSPIAIITNGLKFDPQKSYYVEQINKDDSSLYLTSTQQLPLQTDRTGVLNPLTNPIDTSKYFNAQAILNSDRIVLNSKKDEVMIFAKTNVEISTKNIINLNAGDRVHLNSDRVFLGTVNNQLPTENIVLGGKLHDLLLNLMDALHEFGTGLSSVVGSPEGTPAADIISAARGLCTSINTLENNLEGILSQQNFTA